MCDRTMGAHARGSESHKFRNVCESFDSLFPLALMSISVLVGSASAAAVYSSSASSRRCLRSIEVAGGLIEVEQRGWDQHRPRRRVGRPSGTTQEDALRECVCVISQEACRCVASPYVRGDQLCTGEGDERARHGVRRQCSEEGQVLRPASQLLEFDSFDADDSEDMLA